MDGSFAHCRDHGSFVEACPVCRQARANHEPYPVRATKPVARSFGFTDDLTAASLKAPEPASGFGFTRSQQEGEFSLSLAVIRFILRLIWPFSRII